jgi:hypothetical protein
MVRLWIGVVVAAVAFTVYCVIDTATMPRQRIRSLGRAPWVVIVLVLPVLGGVLWFLLGRSPASGSAPAGRYRGPDDDPDFIGGVQPPRKSRTEKDQDDATLRDLERQFHERRDGHGEPGGDDPDGHR